MKEHSVSQLIAPPTTIPINIQPSANELMVDWLAVRVKQAIETVIREARPLRVDLNAIDVFGFEYYDEPTRVIFIHPMFDAAEKDAYDYWGVLAEAFAEINRPRPQEVPNDDVTVEIFISG